MYTSSLHIRHIRLIVTTYNIRKQLIHSSHIFVTVMLYNVYLELKYRLNTSNRVALHYILTVVI
jgi:hypothetical protein